MIDIRALFYGLAGASRLVRLDICGAHMMVGGTKGFWTSLIYSAVLVAPFYALLMALRFNPETHDGTRYIISETLSYGLAWMIFPVVMERVCTFLNRRHRFLDFIIAYNWLSCLYNIIYLLIGLARASNLINADSTITLATIMMLIGFIWISYLAKHTLRLPYSAAIGIVVMELLLSVFLNIFTSGMGFVQS